VAQWTMASTGTWPSLPSFRLVGLLEVSPSGRSGWAPHICAWLHLGSGSRNRAQKLWGEKEQRGSPQPGNQELLFAVCFCSSIAVACREWSCWS